MKFAAPVSQRRAVLIARRAEALGEADAIAARLARNREAARLGVAEEGVGAGSEADLIRDQVF